MNIYILAIMIISRLSYQLGEQERYNTKFGNTEDNFTFMVPSNEAWKSLKNKYATAYKVN